MGMESFGNQQPKINLEDYEGKVVLQDGKYKTISGVNLTEKEGKLYVAEGESDAGTMLLKKDDGIIKSS
jgi:hypothetical protein